MARRFDLNRFLETGEASEIMADDTVSKEDYQFKAGSKWAGMTMSQLFDKDPFIVDYLALHGFTPTIRAAAQAVLDAHKWLGADNEREIADAERETGEGFNLRQQIIAELSEKEPTEEEIRKSEADHNAQLEAFEAAQLAHKKFYREKAAKGEMPSSLQELMDLCNLASDCPIPGMESRGDKVCAGFLKSLSEAKTIIPFANGENYTVGFEKKGRKGWESYTYYRKHQF